MPVSEIQRDKHVSREVHKLYWRAMWQSKGHLLTTVLLHPIVFFITNVYISLIVAYGIEAVITKHFERVPGYALQVVILALVANVLLSIATWAFNRNGTAGGVFVQREIFSNYLSKDYDFYSNTYIGALGAQAARLRDAFVDYQYLVHFAIPKTAVIIIFSLVILAFKSVVLALIALVCMLLVLSFTIAVAGYRLKYRRLLSEASSQLAGVLGDALSHATAVKSFANERYESKRLSGALKKWYHAQLKSWDLFIPSNFGRSMLLAIITAILLVVSARLYKNGAISIAIVALVQFYVLRLINTTIEIGDMIKDYEKVMSMAYQPVATMLIPATVVDKPEAIALPTKQDLTLNFQAVSYHYPEAADGNDAVSDFTLEVKSGQKIGLVGYSGSGKTTLTKLLLRFIDTTQGSISINGHDLRDIAQTDLRSLIAYVPQEPLLFHRSIAENIAYAKPGASLKEIEQAAGLAYVSEFVKELPKGFEALVGERGVKLSGGQRQRVAIARALLKDAPILVLDEATSALDSESEKYIQSAIWELMKNRTAIVIAHRLSTIQKMDSIVVMDKGKIVEIGRHDQLLKNKRGIYAKLWTRQSGGYLGEDKAFTDER
ncbi:MAG TPA: ABC transporter ATP-binding protein [Candidatus Saccharimonadales bacterium]|nr:ABC transporter ATP-binding protein [Candidatus Saccharimonadales bacterium]